MVQTFRRLLSMLLLVVTLQLMAPAASSTLALDGPPHACWGTTVQLRVTPSDPTASAVRYTASLAHRRDGAPAWGGLPVRFTGSRAPSSLRTVHVRLPHAPDTLGNLDGDYDLTVTAHSGSESYSASHPIHIETRDEEGKIRGRYMPRITDLIGANSAPARTTPDWLTETGIRHSREHCGWDEFQPEADRWNEAAFAPDSRFSSLILQARRYNMTVLPLLCGTPEWAQARDANGVRLGGWGPPADPAQWEAFIDRIVAHYSQPPYSQQDWQVWNEAQINTGFWSGSDMEQFIRTVYLPAARAIRRHYVDRNQNGKEDPGERCRVVYGGYPCLYFNDGSYARVLQIDNAGAFTDILDAHYMNGYEWFMNRQQSGDVFTRWFTNGPASGLWLTEEGDGFSQDPIWLPATFSRMTSWALEHRWAHAHQYRVFYFHYYMAQPQTGLFWGGQRKWPNGYAISTFMHVMRGDLTPLDQARRLETSDDIDVQALYAGGRLTLFAAARRLDASGEARLRFQLKPRESLRSARRLSVIQGASLPLTIRLQGRDVTVQWPYTPLDRSQQGMESSTAPVQYFVFEFMR